MILKLVLCSALIVSLITDIRSRKILNLVTLPTIFLALIYYISTSGLEGFVFSGKGLLTGLGLLLLPFLLGGIGAGDVKLMAAIGALMGTSFVFYSFIYTALIGGAIAIILIIKKRGFWQLLRTLMFNVTFLRGNLGSMIINKKEEPSSFSFPYGIPIVMGTFYNLFWGGF